MTSDQKRYSAYKKNRKRAIKLLGNKCKRCKKPAKTDFNLHHKKYHPVESNYPRDAVSMTTREKRVDEALRYPNRFELLCSACHGKAHGGT